MSTKIKLINKNFVCKKEFELRADVEDICYIFYIKPHSKLYDLSSQNNLILGEIYSDVERFVYRLVNSIDMKSIDYYNDLCNLLITEIMKLAIYSSPGDFIEISNSKIINYN